ncbi:MAG: glycosyltransferase [Cyanobacteria bacterium J06643_4]
MEYGIDAYRVTNGVSDRFCAAQDGSENALAKALNIQARPLYLTVGGIEPRKNSISLLKAFAKVRQQQPTAQLLIAGGATLFDYQDYRQAFMSLADAHGLKDALILPGVIADEDMPALYRLADAFVFPSIKEGWGLVVLEAIKSGLPVLTANQPPFTEFLTPQDACLVNPHSVNAIAAGMISLTENTSQKSLPSKVPLPTWKTSAQQHLTLYHQLTTH